MSLEILADSLISGVALGGIYALAASGLALVYGAAGVLNFAHGSLIMIGAYAAWFIYTLTGSVVFSLLAGFLLPFSIGGFLEKILFSTFRKRPNESINIIFVSITAALLLEVFSLVVFGPRRKSIAPLMAGFYNLGPLTISAQKLAIITISIAILLLLWFFLTRTRFGIMIRAVSQDTESAQILGVDLKKVYTLVLAIGSGVAGISGFLLGSIFLVYPKMGELPLVISLIIIAIGGLGNVQGTIISSFMLALIQSLTATYLSLGWSLPIMLATVCVIFIVRPTGIFKGRV
jgi:branched-chain amino acid transport system permease protein